MKPVPTRVLLSIKPEYVEAIRNGSKRYEFRRKIWEREGITTVVIYSTMPVGKVVGEFKIGPILNESPHRLWDLTKPYGGVDSGFFLAYFTECKGYAITIGECTWYAGPKTPQELFGVKPPQSFLYLP